VLAAAQNLRSNAETLLPTAAATLHLYLQDARTEALLLKAIKVRILSSALRDAELPLNPMPLRPLLAPIAAR